MITQKELADLKIGEKIDHYFIISKFEEKLTKTNKPYLNLELRDKSANLPAKVWNNFDDIKDSLQEGDLAKVSGKLEEFSGMPQIKVDSIRQLLPNEKISHSDFLPKSKRPLVEMQNEFDERISQIENPHLNKLVKTILNKEKLDSYFKVPAGKAWHHSYIHGLLEHTLEILKICDLMCNIHPDLDRDLLFCGAILHDFGKTEELTFEKTFDYTDKGKLLGHIVIAAMEIEKAASNISDFPEDKKNHLIHLVLSHQGKLEYATPVEPKTLEAIVLYHADELSAKTNAYKLAIENDKKTGASWTKYLPLAGTSLFIPQENKEDKPKDTLFD